MHCAFTQTPAIITVKVTVCAHAVEVWGGGAGIVPLILNVSTIVNHPISILRKHIFINSGNVRARSQKA